MIGRTRVLPAWLVGVLATACSSRPNPAVTPAQACANLAMALCNLRAICGRPQGTTGPGASVVEVYGDMSTCLAREALACGNRLAAPDTGNSAAAVERCVAKFSSYSCADFFDGLPPGECTPLGRRPDGAGCAFDDQCQSGVCNGTKAAACGTCGAPVAAGEDCTTSNCVRGARCLAATGTCANLAAFGRTCDEKRPCGHGLSCVPRVTSDGGPARDAGTGADAALDASTGADGGTDAGTGTGPDAGPPADAGAGADGGDGDAARVAALATGGTCQLAGTHIGAPCGEPLPDCDGARGLTCGGDPGAMTCGTVEVAAARAPDGDPCDTTSGPDCVPPARCMAGGGSTVGTCVIPAASACPGG